MFSLLAKGCDGNASSGKVFVIFVRLTLEKLGVAWNEAIARRKMVENPAYFWTRGLGSDRMATIEEVNATRP